MLGAWGGRDACPSLWNALVAPGAGGRWRRQTAKPNMEAASRWLPGRAGPQESRHEWSPWMIGWIDTQGYGQRKDVDGSVSRVFMGSLLSQNPLSHEYLGTCSHHLGIAHSPITSLNLLTCLCLGRTTTQMSRHKGG